MYLPNNPHHSDSLCHCCMSLSLMWQPYWYPLWKFQLALYVYGSPLTQYSLGWTENCSLILSSSGIHQFHHIPVPRSVNLLLLIFTQQMLLKTIRNIHQDHGLPRTAMLHISQVLNCSHYCFFGGSFSVFLPFSQSLLNSYWGHLIQCLQLTRWLSTPR